MRRFRLNKVASDNKELKETLGYTAEGIEFSNGTCVLHWLLPLDYLGIYESIEVIEFKYSHGGKTIIEWVDTEKGLKEECHHNICFNKRTKNYSCTKCGVIFKSV